MANAKWNEGRVVWRELVTTNVDEAKGFYGELFNWTIDAVPMGPVTYYMLKAGERHVGGLVNPGQPGVPTHWMSYVSTADVDAAAKRAQAAGGQVLAGPDTMGPGRYAIVRDPKGATIALWHALEGDGDLPEKPSTSEFCWEDLVTSDADAVKPFYREVFGWESAAFDPEGKILVWKRGEQVTGGIQTETTAGTPSHWMNYVVVDDVAKSRERARKLGATVLVEDVPVADFGRIAVLLDPQRAVIGLFEDVRK